MFTRKPRLQLEKFAINGAKRLLQHNRHEAADLGCPPNCRCRGTGQFQNPASIEPRTYLFLVLSGFATGASWLCYFRALKLGNASQVAPIDKLSVVLVAIFGALLLGEKLTVLNWLGVALIALGALLVAL